MCFREICSNYFKVPLINTMNVKNHTRQGNVKQSDERN